MQRGIVECRKKYPTKKTELRLPAAVQPFKSFKKFIFRCFNIRFQYLDLDLISVSGVHDSGYKIFGGRF